MTLPAQTSSGVAVPLRAATIKLNVTILFQMHILYCTILYTFSEVTYLGHYLIDYQQFLCYFIAIEFTCQSLNLED